MSAPTPADLDLAVTEDGARWPAAVTREGTTARRTFPARCALAEAHDAVHRAAPDGTGPGPGAAADHGPRRRMDVASSSDQVAARWLDDPEQAVALVHELAAEGELAIDESLGATIDVVVVTGLPALSEACTTAATDPSTAAELCLPSYPPRARGHPGRRRPRPHA